MIRNSPVIVMLLIVSGSATAQQRFELVVPGGSTGSTAEISANVLQVTHQGQTHSYQRDPQYDALGYTAYSNRQLAKAIRWPTSNTGAMQVGTISALRVSFTQSRMRIAPSRGNPANRPDIVPGVFAAGGEPVDSGTLYRLTNRLLGPSRSFDADKSRTVAMGQSGQFDSQLWFIVSAGNGFCCLRNAELGPEWSLAVNSRSNRPYMERTDGRSKRQRWKIDLLHGDDLRLTNEALGKIWSLDGDAALGGQPVVATSRTHHGQYWHLTKVRQIPAIAIPRPRFISRDVEPNPPLAPAKVEFANTREDELWVLVADLRDPTMSIRVRIPKGGSKTLLLDRDSGATVVEVWETPQPQGRWRLEERVAVLPSEQIYDISVYEVVVQSIAIDGTKKGRGKIEDINLAPRSVGMFPVPAGEGLRAGKTDVYAAAKRQSNPGAVRRIDPKDWESAK